MFIYCWEKIRLQRKLRGVSQKELAFRCSITQSFMSRIERGDRYPDAQLIAIIADLLGVSLGFFYRPATSMIEYEEVLRKQNEMLLRRMFFTAKGKESHRKRKKMYEMVELQVEEIPEDMLPKDEAEDSAADS